MFSPCRFNGDDKPYLPEGLKLLDLGVNKLCDWADILSLEPQLRRCAHRLHDQLVCTDDFFYFRLKTLILSNNELPEIFLEGNSNSVCCWKPCLYVHCKECL